jgi:hypothetical protein
MDGPQLHDIHLPAAPGFWPPAPGWWLLALILFSIVAASVWKWRQVRIRRQRHRAVLAQLQHVRNEWLRHADSQRFAADVSAFLRRLARVREPASVALPGPAWLDHLRLHGAEFDAAAQRALLEAPYRPGVPIDVDALYAQVERHVRTALRAELRDV